VSVPLLLALVAGTLAPLNPCGFPMLPAFLSFYAGAREESLPRASNRIAQALAVGLLVTAGYLGVYALIGMPITFGAGLLARVLPWAGLLIGLTLLVVGLVALAGRKVALPLPTPFAAAERGYGRAMVLFGAGYGVAALSCTLPTFLALVGVSLGAPNAADAVAVFAVYGIGVALSFMTLALVATLFQQGLARGLRRLAPYMSRISGALLAFAGAYLTYYWARNLFGSSATLASDPLIGPVTLFSARLAVAAADRGLPIVLAIGLMIVLAVALSARQLLRRAMPR
jgi:cytochrome c-type biogenesis protein